MSIPGIFLSTRLFAGLSDGIKTIGESFDQFGEKVDQLEKMIKSLYEVLQTIADVFSTIRSLFGIEIIIFTLIVFLIAAGLSSVGLVRGKIAFVISICLADFFWITWLRAQQTETLSYLYIVVKTNLLLISPYIIVMLLKYLFPHLKNTVRKLIFSKKSFEKEEFVASSKKIMELYKDFSVNIQQDITGNDENIIISSETVSTIRKLEKELKNLKNHSAGKLQSSKINANPNEEYNENSKLSKISSEEIIIDDYDDLK